jgi:2-oxoglutarate ferredoxin oxidoreductase subunit beta
MKYVVMLLDNSIYGLTKMQTSPTSPKGFHTNTHPYGAIQAPMNPLSVTLGITNASFVAQTVDWNPAHLYATLQKAHHHPGLAFVRIVQRCPHYMTKINEAIQSDPSTVLLLRHESGIVVDDAVAGLFPNQEEHDPSDLNGAREIATREGVVPIGLLYRNDNAERYDLPAAKGLGMSPQDKLAALNEELDKFLV